MKTETKFRNFYEEEANRDLAEKIREARRKKRLTQDALNHVIEDILQRELEKKGFAMNEIQNYFEQKLSEEERAKFKKIGISSQYSRIAVATISGYESGNMKIPASYILLLQKVLGNLEI